MTCEKMYRLRPEQSIDESAKYVPFTSNIYLN